MASALARKPWARMLGDDTIDLALRLPPRRTIRCRCRPSSSVGRRTRTRFDISAYLIEHTRDATRMRGYVKQTKDLQGLWSQQ